jgi:hypothetical protein
MLKPEDVTFSVPRFLSFIELAYLLEATKAADAHLATRMVTSDKDSIGNVNATRQSLLRAAFIASYAIFEQNLDELVQLEGKKQKSSLSPSDLKDRGVVRSLTYAIKVLGKSIDTSLTRWRDLLLLQEVRNHLVHFGSSFSGTKDHDNRFEKFTKLEYVTLRPMICFSIEQIEKIFDLYIECVDDFSA